ncbi:MAG: hypothetical protein RLZZ600_679 [Actinomycetota bacterium]
MRVYRRALRCFTVSRSYTQSMTVSFSARSIRIGVSVLAVTALGLSLTACANPNPVPATASKTAAPAPEPTASETTAPAELVGVPMSMTCEDVLSPDALYNLKGGANWAMDDSFTPSSGTTAAAIVALGGIACGFTNQTSGDDFSIAVAQVTPESVPLLHTQLEKLFGAGTAVKDYSPTASIKGYFRTVKGVGQAQIATAAYWASITSETFEVPADVSELVHDVENSLGQ